MNNNTAVLISVRLEWTRLILSGQKTVEVRKSRPSRTKLEPPFRCYIYCSKGGELLLMDHGQIIQDRHYSRPLDNMPERLMTGRVVAEFTCDKIRHYPMPQSREDSSALRDFWQAAMLKTSALYEYSGGWAHDLYGWHISNLRVYDKPLPLSDFWNLRGEPIRRAPQSWGYVRGRNEDEQSDSKSL